MSISLNRTMIFFNFNNKVCLKNCMKCIIQSINSKSNLIYTEENRKLKYTK